LAYLAAKTLDEALAAVSDPEVSVIAGGTDWYPARGDRPLPGNILDISRLSDLRGIEKTTTGWRIGATTRWSDLYKLELPAAFDGLILCAREVGSIQIQNAATILGNLCNASPAADGVPPLLALNAQIEIRGKGSHRVVALSDFIKGVRQTDLQPGELATAILIPDPNPNTRSSFLKLGARKYLVISIAMVAANLRLSDGKIAEVAIAVGACSLVAQRLSALEKDLIGLSPENVTADIITATHLAPLTPIEDVRGTPEYRLASVKTLIERVLRAAT